MLDEAKEQLGQARDYVMGVNDKADLAVDSKIDRLQESIDRLQAQLEKAKESRFTWLIVAGIAAALLSLGGFIALF